MTSKRPSSTDKYISRRVRERREFLQLTQPDLADRLGLTFQQFQKYENGINRIPAGRLYEIARALKTSILHFYPGGEGTSAAVARGVAEEGAEFEGPLDEEAAELVCAFRAIDSPAKRKAILAAVRNEATPRRKRKRN